MGPPLLPVPQTSSPAPPSTPLHNSGLVHPARQHQQRWNSASFGFVHVRSSQFRCSSARAHPARKGTSSSSSDAPPPGGFAAPSPVTSAQLRLRQAIPRPASSGCPPGIRVGFQTGDYRLRHIGRGRARRAIVSSLLRPLLVRRRVPAAGFAHTAVGGGRRSWFTTTSVIAAVSAGRHSQTGGSSGLPTPSVKLAARPSHRGPGSRSPGARCRRGTRSPSPHLGAVLRRQIPADDHPR